MMLRALRDYFTGHPYMRETSRAGRTRAALISQAIVFTIVAIALLILFLLRGH